MKVHESRQANPVFSNDGWWVKRQSGRAVPHDNASHESQQWGAPSTLLLNSSKEFRSTAAHDVSFGSSRSFASWRSTPSAIANAHLPNTSNDTKAHLLQFSNQADSSSLSEGRGLLRRSRAHPHSDTAHESHKLTASPMPPQKRSNELPAAAVRHVSHGGLRSLSSQPPKPTMLASESSTVTNNDARVHVLHSSLGEHTASIGLVVHKFKSHQSASMDAFGNLNETLGRSYIEPTAKSGTVGDELRHKKSMEVLGLPKIFWALVADLVAMALFVACIPLILTVAKKRPSPNLCTG